MKLQDPTAPYADVIGRRRRERAASSAEHFRLGGRAPGERSRPSTGRVAVLGASGWALDDERVELTAAHLGALGGLLADLGYDVFAVSSLPDLDTRPAFVGWVGGGETASEHEQLVAIDAPGLSIGRAPEGAQAWGSIEPEGPPTDIEFIRSTLHAIRRLTDDTRDPQGAASGANASTVPSTVRPGTGVHGTGQPGYRDPRDPSKRARSGTERDRPNERSEGS